MRVIAGKYRHRLLIYPDDASIIRPTKDRVREALFSALGDLSSLTVLDLYSGSGAMGIEALSRGAKEAVLVDNYKLAIDTIKKNIDNLKIDNATIIYKNDVEALELIKKKGMTFDLVILDPPYKTGDYINIILLLYKEGLLAKGARIVTECDYELDFSSIPHSTIKTYQYGEIKVNVIYS